MERKSQKGRNRGEETERRGGRQHFLCFCTFALACVKPKKREKKKSTKKSESIECERRRREFALFPPTQGESKGLE